MTTAPKPSRQQNTLKSVWKKLRVWVRNSPVAQNIIATGLAWLLRLVNWTNRRISQSHDTGERAKEVGPAIAALWHGQHLMGPFIRPKHLPMVALFSKSADAELNAQVAQKLGLEIVRGSGGRANTANMDKGGARALLRLKKALENGKYVAMIADVSHHQPRFAGLGIVTLAKISGKPIVPVAYVTSRRKVLERSWDKTTVNLPFGRSAIITGNAIHVPADASSEQLEMFRQQVTDELNAVNAQAYQAVDQT